MLELVIKVLFSGWIASCAAFPFPEGKSEGNFIGEGTDEIATALLQGFVHEDDNMVYSPLGYSTVLAIFAEGARGASREEIATALHFPDDIDLVRKSYKRILERLIVKNQNPNTPEFKNWFYIYKNYTVKEDLQNVLRKFYLTEVRSVDRPDDFDVESEEDKKISPPQKEDNKNIEDYDKQIVSLAESAHKVDSEEAMTNNQQAMLADKPEKTGTSTSAPVVEITPKPVTDEKKDNCDEEEKKTHEATPESSMEEVVAKVEEQKPMGELIEEHKKVKTDGEVMIAMQRDAEGGGVLDHFSGMTDSSLKIKGNGPLSQMIIFNGLYYRGDWETPFVKKPAHDSRVFYKSEKDKIFVSTIHSEGNFNSGNIQNLDCKAIELPYKGGRYSLLILVPNARDGLSKLTADLSGYPIKKVYEQLTEKSLEVCLPSFEISTISKPISSFSKLGLSRVTSIFDPEKADLSGISEQDPGLYVEELVQMVSFRVDADYSDTNFLTASLASSRTEYEKFPINQPFLFFLRDKVEDIVIVNGKVTDPTPKPDFFES